MDLLKHLISADQNLKTYSTCMTLTLTLSKKALSGISDSAPANSLCFNMRATPCVIDRIIPNLSFSHINESALFVQRLFERKHS